MSRGCYACQHCEIVRGKPFCNGFRKPFRLKKKQCTTTNGHCGNFKAKEEWKQEWKEQPAVETRADTSIRHTPIEKLELSVRSYNCLKRAKKDTIGDVIDMTFDEMLHIRNLGRRSAEEIANRLAGMGLHNATVERLRNE